LGSGTQKLSLVFGAAHLMITMRLDNQLFRFASQPENLLRM
jgi:hypothetical protein